MLAVLPEWAFFPAVLDYFSRRTGSGDASVGVSPDVIGDISGDVSVDVSTDTSILASTLSQFVRTKRILVLPIISSCHS